MMVSSPDSSWKCHVTLTEHFVLMWIYPLLVLHVAFPSLIFLQEEVNDVSSVLSVHGDSIKVAEALQDGDALTFIIVSQKVWK